LHLPFKRKEAIPSSSKGTNTRKEFAQNMLLSIMASNHSKHIDLYQKLDITMKYNELTHGAYLVPNVNDL
jgi:hypothetical protein